MATHVVKVAKEVGGRPVVTHSFTFTALWQICFFRGVAKYISWMYFYKSIDENKYWELRGVEAYTMFILFYVRVWMKTH
jgi:hypothetical protein